MIPLTTKLKAVFITGEDDNLSRYSLDYWNETLESVLITNIVKMEFYTSDLLDDYDLGISTLRVIHPKVINVSRDMTLEDSKLINTHASQLINAKETTTRTKLTFSPEIVECDLSFKDKNSLLKHGYELLLKNGYVTKEFWPSLLEREIKTSTFIGNHIAIPHVYLTGVQKTGVCVLKLSRLLKWDSKDQVELVFILAINILDKESMNDYFAEFYRLIGTDSVITKIRKAHTCESLFETLNESL